MINSKSTKLIFLISLISVLLSACGGDNSDLKQYMRDVKKKPTRPIDPIPQFAPLPKFRFPDNDNRRSPFKLGDANMKKNSSGPDMRRPKQPLEAFPLDALKFVGTIEQPSEVWALILQPDKQVTRIKVGEYIGQNYGRVVVIKNDYIKIEELYNSAGVWEKKITTLKLNTDK